MTLNLLFWLFGAIACTWLAMDALGDYREIPNGSRPFATPGFRWVALGFGIAGAWLAGISVLFVAATLYYR